MTIAVSALVARVGIALVVGSVVLIAAAFIFARDILCVDSSATHADVLIVLGGESIQRTARAVELYQSGAAPKIIVSGDGDGNDIGQRLVQAGVPASAVELENESRNTKQNAQFTSHLLKQRGVKSAIIVTSWFHSRRAGQSFSHFAPNVRFFSRPTFAREPWESMFVHVSLEYVKTIWYGLRYGIFPWPNSVT